MEKGYQSKERKFFVEYLPDEVFNGFTKEERSVYSKYRNRHLNYHKKNVEIEELQLQIQKLKSLLKNKKNEVKRYQKELFNYYDKIKHLNKNIDYILWIEEEWRNKKECIKDSTIIPQKRVVVMVEYKLKGYRSRKKISCGNRESIIEILNEYNSNKIDYSKLEFEDLRIEIEGFVDGYTKYHIYKNGFQNFHNTPHNLKKVIQWYNQYDDVNGKGKGFDWSWYDY